MHAGLLHLLVPTELESPPDWQSEFILSVRSMLHVCSSCLQDEFRRLLQQRGGRGIQRETEVSTAGPTDIQQSPVLSMKKEHQDSFVLCSRWLKLPRVADVLCCADVCLLCTESYSLQMEWMFLQ